MAVYRHTQPGILNRLIIGAFILVVIVLAVFLGEGDPTAMWVMLMVSGILLVALALFHSLTVEIRHGRLRIRFGVGLIRIGRFGTVVQAGDQPVPVDIFV
mgnify:CR=1 FL=1